MASDLEAELELLRRSLEEKGLELQEVIGEETQRREAALQVALLAVVPSPPAVPVSLNALCSCSEAALRREVCSAVG